MSSQAGGKKESAVDLAKLVDKSIRVKLAGGREGMQTQVVGAHRARAESLHVKHPVVSSDKCSVRQHRLVIRAESALDRTTRIDSQRPKPQQLGATQR